MPGQVGLAHAFVAWVLGGSHPDADVAVLLASELVTNSVLHSGSAVPGGVVTVVALVAFVAWLLWISVTLLATQGEDARQRQPAASL